MSITGLEMAIEGAIADAEAEIAERITAYILNSSMVYSAKQQDELAKSLLKKLDLKIDIDNIYNEVDDELEAQRQTKKEA